MKFITLDGKDAREIDPQNIPWPDGTIVLYAVEQGDIVGRQAYLLLPHLEGAWVAEDKRGSSLALKLVKKMEKTVAESGYPAVFAYVLDSQPEIAGYMERIGYNKLPLTIWMKPVEAKTKETAA